MVNFASETFLNYWICSESEAHCGNLRQRGAGALPAQNQHGRFLFGPPAANRGRSLFQLNVDTFHSRPSRRVRRFQLPKTSKTRTDAAVSRRSSGAGMARAPCCRRPARPTSPPTSRPFGPSCSRRRGPAAVRRREARRPAGRSSRPGRGISRATEAHGRNNGGFLGLRRTGIWWCRGWRGRRGACPSRRSPVSQRRRRPVVSKEEGVREEQDQEQEEEQEEGAGARGGRRREKPEVQSHRLAAFRPVARASEPPASGGGGGRGGGGGVGAEAENGGGRDGGGEGGRGG